MKFLDINGLKVVLQRLLSKVATAFDSLDYRVENLEGNYLSKKDSAASAKKLDADAGADNQPVYFENGIPVAIGYTINSDVPKNAKFTDTTYADATNTKHGLMSIDDKKKLDNMPTELDKKLDVSLKGIAGGLAELDSTGRVPANQLPSFVDDVVEGYYFNSKFYKESTHGTVIDGEAGKIYIDLSTNKTYRWGGTAFTVISETLAIGNTATTAGRGDWTKTAYDHSQLAHAPSNAQANQNAFSKVTVGDTTISSGNATDTLTLTAGTNVTLTPDTSGKNVTIASKDTTYGVVSSSANGLAPKSDGSTNKYLRADGSWQIPPNTDTKYNNFTGASASTNGNAGLVPAPNMGDQNKYLKADGSWSTPPDTNTDTKVSQTVTTTTGNYPILLGSAGQTATKTQGAYFGQGITANPNTSTITATTFSGKATSAGTADSATKVKNALTFTGSVSDSYDGSAAKSIAIPSVSDKKITITQGDSIKGSFTLNQNSDLTIALADTNTWTAFKGATSTTAGTAGYISTVPQAGQTTSYFRSDGTWAIPPDTKYTHPTTAGNKHIPTGGASGQLLGYSASGTAKWVDGFTAITDTEIDDIMTEVFG